MKAFVIAALLGLLVSPASAVEISRCLLEVGGKVMLDEPCEYEADPDGSFRMGVAAGGRPQSRYFVYLFTDTPATAYWNGEPNATYAHSPLGEVHREGACWIGDEVRICAYK